MSTLPEHLDYPAIRVKCATCPTFKEHVTQCEEIKCCWAYQRRGYEGRVRDDARNKAAKDVRLKEDRMREDA
ncbi:MAG: hypothetical protein WC978_00240 [bacterium]